MKGRLDAEQEMKAIAAARASSWARFARTLVTPMVPGRLWIRPAVAGVLEPSTVALMDGPQVISLKYGTVLPASGLTRITRFSWHSRGGVGTCAAARSDVRWR